MTSNTFFAITALVLVVAMSVRHSTAVPIDQLLNEFLVAAGESEPNFDDDYADYDLHFDQRQNGTENYRLNVDGVMIALPAASQSSLGSLGLLASGYLLDIADAAGNGGDEDDDEEAETDNDDKPYRFELNDENISGKRGEKRPDGEHDVLGAEQILGVNSGAEETLTAVEIVPKKEIQLEVVETLEPEVTVDVVQPATVGAEAVRTVNAVPIAEQQTRQKASGAQKKRNKHKLRLGNIIEYLKRSRN